MSLLRTTCALSSALLLAAIFSASGPAQAAPPALHCVAEAGTPTTAPGVPTCFATFPEAISFATKGAVKLPAGATSLTASQLTTAALASTVLGVSYWNTGYGGSSYTHLGGSGCDTNSDVDFYFQFPAAWNDKAGSGREYGLCDATYWDNGHGTYGSGAQVAADWSGGAMNDHATFIEWR
jgi:hypothetical protein